LLINTAMIYDYGTRVNLLYLGCGDATGAGAQR